MGEERVATSTKNLKSTMRMAEYVLRALIQPESGI